MKNKVGLLDYAELLDAYRVFPRTFVCAYGLFAVHVGDWYMGLTNPNNAQAAFAGAVIGICGPILNWYMKTGRDWASRRYGNEDEYRDDWRPPRGRRGDRHEEANRLVEEPFREVQEGERPRDADSFPAPRGGR